MLCVWGGGGKKDFKMHLQFNVHYTSNIVICMLTLKFSSEVKSLQSKRVVYLSKHLIHSPNGLTDPLKRVCLTFFIMKFDACLVLIHEYKHKNIHNLRVIRCFIVGADS